MRIWIIGLATVVMLVGPAQPDLNAQQLLHQYRVSDYWGPERQFFSVGDLDSGATIFQFFATRAERDSSVYNGAIGDELLLTDGFIGTYDIGAADDPDFSEYASRITNWTNPDSFLHDWILAGSGNRGGRSTTESFIDIDTSDLPGATLDFVRFDVHQWDIDQTVQDLLTYDYTVEFWGTPDPNVRPPTPDPIPEPGSLAIWIVLGLTLTSARLRRRKR